MNPSWRTSTPTIVFTTSMTGACPCCCATDASWPKVESRPTRWPGRWARASERGPAPADYGRDNIALRQLKAWDNESGSLPDFRPGGYNGAFGGAGLRLGGYSGAFRELGLRGALQRRLSVQAAEKDFQGQRRALEV